MATANLTTNANELDISDILKLTDQIFRPYSKVGVAYSGGVDSATLLALAHRALGPARVIAILGVSPSLASDEREAAHATAKHIGVEVVEVKTFEGDNHAYRANGPDRCFHCKDELFTRISDDLVNKLDLDAVAYGENADDAKRSDRPGSQAATNHRVLRPLSQAQLTKSKVRAMARYLDVPVADKPAAPCLASRIPHYEEVTPEKLAQVNQAESAMRKLGFSDCRVRHHGEIARIEVPQDEIVRAGQLHAEIEAAGADAGFRFVTLDMRGIQSGAFTLPLIQINNAG